ncbi:MAG: DUF4886 domain-containing protein [Clostridia bacterium]|nr:DUF4886 domain-containing protein [Clostridia bacterium]
MRSLSIGNSFSQDACSFLHQAAKSAKIDWECVNLYIGGCSLEYHAENLRENRRNYSLEINGQSTGRTISIKEALEDLGDFDFITLQQASHFSGMEETYFPFITELFSACRQTQPDAATVIHETWAYETDSTHDAFVNYGHSQQKMFSMLHDAYKKAADMLGTVIIPVGDTIQHFREKVSGFDYPNGGKPLTRDGFHLSIPDGRFIAALVWIEILAKTDARKVVFLPDGMTETRRDMIEKNVHSFLQSYINEKNDLSV